ncbi:MULTISPECIES: LysR family transcriptional regulator [Pseudomonas]|jgi:DNA-binding transcriptional LysR family regulator|uniref:LysR family transcriptional regulator n=1 Tax=Pseudomonas TaxID=286 RepID=UPI0004841DF6|nr:MULTISPECIES: LysR family transcriptional regulator [Pseudomonas]MBF6040021.1 LysR family transcriptional regulator [Pseudomonas mucoides]CRL51800.1 Hca operon transcriptional activator [Pseudomonas sp. URMO17WK12:I11]
MLGTVSELDLRLIRVFLTVVEAGGISAAQTALNTTQPTISAQLATLEARVGFRLCERGRGGFSVTPKGGQFVEAARRLLAAAEGFRVEVQHINRKVSGIINIGLLGQIDPSANKNIALAIARLRSRHEGLYFHFTELSSSLLEEKIINGHIDLAIGYFWHRLPNIDYFPLFQETQIAYCAPAHPLFDHVGDLSREDVRDYDWVWPSHPLPEMPAPTSIERLTVLTDSMDGAALLILSGQHLGFLPQHYAAKHEELGQLHPLNPELLRYEVGFHAAVRHSARQREVVSAFLAELIGIFADG